MGLKKLTQQQIETALKKLGVSGILYVNGLGVFCLWEGEDERLRVMDATRTELMYEDRNREMRVESWLRNSNKKNNKDEVGYIG